MIKLFYEDLENKVNEIVMEYLQLGYVINIKTMVGHEGELFKIDLKNKLEPNNIIRVFMDRKYNSGRDDIRIFVVKYYNVPNADSLWNSRYDEIISQNIYYEYIPNRDYGQNRGRRYLYLANINDYNELEKIKHDRYLSRLTNDRIDINSKLANQIFKYCKTKNGYKSIKKSDLTWIEKSRDGFHVYFSELHHSKRHTYIRYHLKGGITT